MRINKQKNGTHFGDVLARVLRQHDEIRARLRGLDRSAEAATTPIALDHLRIALTRLASAFDAHLAFEETELWPLLRELDVWGPPQETAMAAEHLEQRTRLEEICASADDDSVQAHELAGEVRWLVMSLLQDMTKEEAELANFQRTIDTTLAQLSAF